MTQPTLGKSSCLLAMADERTIRRNLSGITGQAPRFWVYFGTDTACCERIADLLGDAVTRRHIAQDLQETADSSRAEYIDVIGGLSAACSSRLWWLTTVSEKNPFVSSLFLWICYLRVLSGLLSGDGTPFLVIAEQQVLLDACRRLAVHAGYETTVLKPPLSGPLFRLRKAGKDWIRGIHFVAGQVFRILLARSAGFSRKNRILSSGSLHVIHSWTDRRSFQDGTYQNVYFHALAPIIEKAGGTAADLVQVLPTLPYRSAVRMLRESARPVMLVEEFLRFRDPVAAMFSVWRYRPPIPGVVLSDGLDITPLVRAELDEGRFDTRSAQSYLAYCAGSRLARRLRVASFIYTFENHMWEKMFNLAFREHSPETRRIGYVHSIVNRMYTCYTLGRQEAELVPLPDVIAVNGERAARVLAGSGFDRRMMAVWGALRDFAIQGSPGPQDDHGGKTVLVATSAGLGPSLELARIALLSFGNDPVLRVVVKFHPTVSAARARALLPPLPAHFIVSEDPVSVLLPASDLLLYTESTVCVEALGQHIPLIHVKSSFSIDMNILEDVDCVPSYGDPQAIREAAHRILAGPDPCGDVAERAVADILAEKNPAAVRSSLGSGQDASRIP
ncbi:MAG: hypothetical protein GKC04_00875 [Methanomicrobiales archaeon]|nr:hypothetical protein [Methanomicrobiales archaeon]